MVDTTKRNRELVADPPAQRPRLCKSQMVGVGRSASAQKARLRGHELQVSAIAIRRGSLNVRAPALFTVSSGPEPTAGDRTSSPAGTGAAEGGCRRRLVLLVSFPPAVAGSFSHSCAGVAAGESCILAATGCPVAGAVPPAIAASPLPRPATAGSGSSSSSPRANPANLDANAASTRPESAVVRAFFCAECPLRPRRGLFLRDKARQLAEQLVTQGGGLLGIESRLWRRPGFPVR